jgi:hypothetical protein
MTAPDDGLEAALRKALSAAASQVEPGDGGLERILVRTGGATPRSWPASVTVEALRRARHWVWRGHWAWQDSGFWQVPHGPLQGQLADWWRRARGTRVSAWLAGVPADAAALIGGSLVHDSLSRRSHGLMWIRLVAGLAAAASITAVTVADPPLRAALVQVSATVFTGGNGVLQPGTGGPGGTGGRAAGATGTPGASPSGSAGALTSTLPRSGRPGTASGPTPCASASGPAGTATPSASQSSIAPTALPTAPQASTTTAAGTGCPTSSLGALQPSTAPSTPTPTTQAPPTTAPPTTAPPTTAPPTTAPPSPAPPTDTATPTQTASSATGAGTGDSPASGASPTAS